MSLLFYAMNLFYLFYLFIVVAVVQTLHISVTVVHTDPPGWPRATPRAARAGIDAPVWNIYRYATGILIVLILFRGGMVWWYLQVVLIL